MSAPLREIELTRSIQTLLQRYLLEKDMSSFWLVGVRVPRFALPWATTDDFACSIVFSRIDGKPTICP